jgi:hypothetical protein
LLEVIEVKDESVDVYVPRSSQSAGEPFASASQVTASAGRDDPGQTDGLKAGVGVITVRQGTDEGETVLITQCRRAGLPLFVHVPAPTSFRGPRRC